MHLLSSFSEILNKAKNGFSRFPITLIWAIIGTFYTIWFVDQNFKTAVEFKYVKIILTFILGVSWLIATRLIIHYFKDERNKNKAWLIISPLLFLGIYYFNLPNNEGSFNDYMIPYRFALYLITGHLFVFFSPFIFTWNKKAYWNYLLSIFGSFAQSALFSLVLYFGLTIALMALKYLFHFEVKSVRYFELFIFCLGIINTWIFLSDLPKNMQKNTTISYPKPLLIFVKYILIPLTILYLVILYAYSFKILINWRLPKGWVSYLVVALSIIGFIIHILINPIRKTTSSRIIKNFYPYFYYALLPMIGLLFVAIFKRISDYGFTENRYLVLLLAVWIFGMAVYVLFSKRKKLRYFPMSVAILAMLISFGFWGMFSVSKNSQANQFKKIFTKMKASSFKVTMEEKSNFTSVVNYLSNRNAIHKIEPVLGYNPQKVFKNFDGDTFKRYSRYQIASRLSDTLNMVVTDVYKNKNQQQGNYYYTTNRTALIHIKGYDYLKQIHLNKQFFNNTRVVIKHQERIIDTTSRYQFKLDTISNTAILLFKKQDTLRIDLTNFIEKLKKLDREHNYDFIAPENMIFEKEFKNRKLKILFNNLQLKDREDKKTIPLEIININATVLIKEK